MFTPQDEPVVYAGGAAGLVALVVAALQAFGILNLSRDQVEALAALATVAGPVVLALIQRRFVFPAAHVGDADEPDTP